MGLFYYVLVNKFIYAFLFLGVWGLSRQAINLIYYFFLLKQQSILLILKQPKHGCQTKTTYLSDYQRNATFSKFLSVAVYYKLFAQKLLYLFLAITLPLPPAQYILSKYQQSKPPNPHHIILLTTLYLLTITTPLATPSPSYVLREVIVIQDCGGDVEEIWEILPYDARKFQGRYFRVIGNTKRKGQIGSIDQAYKFVKSKYVYHMEDDWAQLGSYGLLERLKDAIEDCQKNQIKVSQAVLTYPQWSWSHMPSKQHRTAHHTKYYLLTSYGKDYLYPFSFNPHLINFQQIYQKILNGSYMTSIARRFHCTNDATTTVMESGGCVEHEAGKYLEGEGYKQIYVEVRKESVYRHIGVKEYQAPQSYNFEIPIQYQLTKLQKNQPEQTKQPQPQKPPKNTQAPQPTPNTNSTTTSPTPTTPPIKPKPTEQQQFLIELFYIFTISITILGCFEFYNRIKKYRAQKKSYQPSSTVDLVQATTLDLEEQEEGEN